jgi:Ni/Co efflux regulator RcnB
MRLLLRGRFARALLAGVLALSAAAPAFADPPHRGGDGRYERHERYDRDYRGDWRRGPPPHWRKYDHDRWRGDYGWRSGPDYRYDRSEQWAYRDGYRDGYRNDNRRSRWYAGAYLPEWRRYSAWHDYNRYRLPPPQRGHYYVDCDGEILLVAAATGLIVWALTQDNDRDGYRRGY